MVITILAVDFTNENKQRLAVNPHPLSMELLLDVGHNVPSPVAPTHRPQAERPTTRVCTSRRTEILLERMEELRLGPGKSMTDNEL